MPAKQRFRLDERPVALGPRQQAAQRGEQSPVSRSKRRPRDLSAKDRNLVTEDDDLDCQIGGVTAPQSQ